MTGETHQIREWRDFLKVPVDRRELCLREFLIWLAMCDDMLILFAGIEMDLAEAFVWIDDDEHTVDISISDGATTIPIVSGVLKDFSTQPKT